MRPDSPDPGHLLLVTRTVTGNGHSTALKKPPGIVRYCQFFGGLFPVPTAACADYLTTPEGAIFSSLSAQDLTNPVKKPSRIVLYYQRPNRPLVRVHISQTLEGIFMTNEQENQLRMTKEQENRWLYAKALEIAVLVKGPFPHEIGNPLGFLTYYEQEAAAIAKRIRNHSRDDGYGLI
jgi:hypothetical protein